MKQLFNVALALVVLASMFTVSAYAGVSYDGSPGTSAPPSTLGGYTMTAFAADGRSLGGSYSTVPGPNGDVGLSPNCSHARVGVNWATWSHGYTGDIYFNGGTTTTLTMPAGTVAFYFYTESNSFSTFTASATTNDGGSSGPVSISGNSGAKYFGFYGTSGSSVTTITVTFPASAGGFAVGEFGIAQCESPTISVTLSPSTLWPPNHNMANIAATVTTTGTCGDRTVQLVSVTSNEADNGDDDGNTVDDIQGVSAGTDDVAFSVRKERSGVGTGRIYTATYMVTDAIGNTATATATVTVPLNQTGKLVANTSGEMVSLVSLSQNIPNPFGTSTQIGFQLAQPEIVTLKIYNVLGYEVATVVSAPYLAGLHTITWDGLTNDGTPAKSGQYVYRIQAAGEVDAKVLTVVR